MMKRLAFLISLLCLAFSAAVPAWAAPFYLGVGTHLYWDNRIRNHELLTGLGVNSFRDDFLWQEVETDQGNLHLPAAVRETLELSEGSLSPLLILAYGNKFYDGGKKPVTSRGLDAFERFCGFAAKELAGRVNLFEVWNEWDHGPEPASAASYLEVVKRAAPAVKRVHPKALVLAGAASGVGIQNGWVEKLVESGVLSYADGISIHPYMDLTPEDWATFLTRFSAKLNRANGGREVPLYITEMGWPGHTGSHGLKAEVVAQYAARALLLVRTVPAVRGFWWYDLKNDGKRAEEREHNFGLVKYDYSPKPALASFRDAISIVRQGRTFTRIAAPSGVVLLEIAGSNGKSYGVWTENGKAVTVTATAIPVKGTAPTVLKVGSSRYRKLPVQNRFQIPIDGTPQIISGLDGIRLEKELW